LRIRHRLLDPAPQVREILQDLGRRSPRQAEAEERRGKNPATVAGAPRLNFRFTGTTSRSRGPSVSP